VQIFDPENPLIDFICFHRAFVRGNLERGECRNLEVKIEELDIYKWFVLIFGEILWFKLLKAFFFGVRSFWFIFIWFQMFIAKLIPTLNWILMGGSNSSDSLDDLAWDTLLHLKCSCQLLDPEWGNAVSRVAGNICDASWDFGTSLWGVLRDPLVWHGISGSISIVAGQHYLATLRLGYWSNLDKLGTSIIRWLNFDPDSFCHLVLSSSWLSARLRAPTA